MKKIICQLHNNPYSSIKITVNKATLICEECLVDCLDNANKKDSQNIIYLKKAVKSFGYFLQRTKLSKEIPQLLEYLSKLDETLIGKQYGFLEEKIQILQNELESIAKKMKEYVEFAIQNLQELITELSLATQYEKFLTLVKDLEMENDNINPDIIQQIEQKFYQYYCSISKESNSELEKQINKILQQQAIKSNKSYKGMTSSLQNQLQIWESQKKEFFDQYLSITTSKNEQFQQQFKISKILPNQVLLTNFDNYYPFNLIQQISVKKIKSAEVIYIGSRDGLKGNLFWSKVNGKCNLLMIFKSKNNGNIFGGYSPCQWQQSLNNYVQDDSLSSFLFSQTRNEIYPLKQDQKKQAICCSSSYGPVFGGGHDMNIAADFKTGYSNLGHTYQWDEYQNSQSDHLFGGTQPNITECEIYQIILE